MNNKFIGKIFVIGIILLFNGLIIAPIINASFTPIYKSNYEIKLNQNVNSLITCSAENYDLLPPLMWTDNFSTFYIPVPQNPYIDQTYYFIEWGDGTGSGWIGPYEPGTTVYLTHVWGEQGSYEIKIKAKNQDVESKWAVYSLTLFYGFKFFHPTLGYVGITYIFTINFDNLSYIIFDWGDGDNSSWLGPIVPVMAYKSWNSPWEYMLRWKAKDKYGYETPWSDPVIITILTIDDNSVLKAPIIDGPKSGNIRTYYEYTFTSIHLYGDDIAYYLILWGDDTYTNKTGPFASGEPVTVSHKWTNNRNYTISARATDVYGIDSYWGTLEITMPRNKISIDILLQRFIQRYPIPLPLLERLLKG